MNRILIVALCAGILSGCATSQAATPSTPVDKSARVDAAASAVMGGRHDQAEALLSDYVYRTKNGSLKLKRLALTGETRKKAIDTVTALLWETGRDVTLSTFANDYLPRYERQVTHCRLAERQARYQDAYRCWNRLGHVDRAERVIRTQSAIHILRD